jgi:hypothetical protein
MTQQPNSALPDHPVSHDIIGRLIELGFLRGDPADPAAVSKALDEFLAANFVDLPDPPRTAGQSAHVAEVTSRLLVDLIELLVVLDVLPPQAVAALFARVGASAEADRMPAPMHRLLASYAQRFGAESGATKEN